MRFEIGGVFCGAIQADAEDLESVGDFLVAF